MTGRTIVVVHCGVCTGAAGRRDVARVLETKDGLRVRAVQVRGGWYRPAERLMDREAWGLDCPDHWLVLDDADLNRAIETYRRSGRVQHVRAPKNPKPFVASYYRPLHDPRSGMHNA